MDITDGRGKHMVVLKLKNRKKVESWSKRNPHGTAMECSRKTGLSYPTVLGHLAALKVESDKP